MGTLRKRRATTKKDIPEQLVPGVGAEPAIPAALEMSVRPNPRRVPVFVPDPVEPPVELPTHVKVAKHSKPDRCNNCGARVKDGAYDVKPVLYTDSKELSWWCAKCRTLNGVKVYRIPKAPR